MATQKRLKVLFIGAIILLFLSFLFPFSCEDPMAPEQIKQDTIQCGSSIPDQNDDAIEVGTLNERDVE